MGTTCLASSLSSIAGWDWWKTRKITWKLCQDAVIDYLGYKLQGNTFTCSMLDAVTINYRWRVNILLMQSTSHWTILVYYLQSQIPVFTNEDMMVSGQMYIPIRLMTAIILQFNSKKISVNQPRTGIVKLFSNKWCTTYVSHDTACFYWI